MAWLEVDDRLFCHPKWLAAPGGARALWVTALSYCGFQNAGGFVATPALAILGGTTNDAADLVRVGLWHEAEGGWRFHDFFRYATRERDDSYRAHQEEVFARDGFACVYCSSPLNLTLDHVIPQSRGGSHEPSNLVTACRSCNSSKGAKTPEEWEASRRVD